MNEHVARFEAAVAANLERQRKYRLGLLTVDDLPQPGPKPDDPGPSPGTSDRDALIAWNAQSERCRVWQLAMDDRDWLRQDLLRKAGC